MAAGHVDMNQAMIELSTRAVECQTATYIYMRPKLYRGREENLSSRTFIGVFADITAPKG